MYVQLIINDLGRIKETTVKFPDHFDGAAVFYWIFEEIASYLLDFYYRQIRLFITQIK